MSGHDIAAKPHKTTHELRPVPGSASQWTHWPNVRTHSFAAPRAHTKHTEPGLMWISVPARERRARASRFDNLMEATR